MKRHIAYGVILVALLFAPVETMNISQLHPVQAVSVSCQWGKVVIETDTEDKGIGDTTALALENLKDTTGGIIYLDTAEYLLIGENAEDVAEDLRGVLKGNTKVCKANGVQDLPKAVEYLRIHKDLPRLKAWKRGDVLPVLSAYEKRFIFLKKVENNA